jgi:hypothetical protein
MPVPLRSHPTHWLIPHRCERIKEFQAHFACLPADVFVKLGKLRAHESLHDSLYVYYSRKDVEEAKNHGEIFVFLSHQWLAWSAPDPENVHAAAMRQAVLAVADEAAVPLDRIRVWVDYISIPQKNAAEQKLAVTSCVEIRFRAPHAIDATLTG